jgi:predicted transcriptional regulator
LPITGDRSISTITIRIEGELKARVAAVAALAGKTAHAFIVDAIAQTVEQVEQDNAFQALADQRWESIQATGKTVGWDAAKAYLEDRAKGQQPRKPLARKPKL